MNDEDGSGDPQFVDDSNDDDDDDGYSKSDMNGPVATSVNSLDSKVNKRMNGATYVPREALFVALRDWLALMLQVSLFLH